MLFECWPLLDRLRRWPGLKKNHWVNSPFLHGCTSYTRCRPIHPIPVQCWTSVAAHCWFNTSQSSATLAQRYSNTGQAHHTSTPAFTATTGRLPNVVSMLIQHVSRRPNNKPTFCIHILRHSTAAIAMRVTLFRLSPERQLGLPR